MIWVCGRGSWANLFDVTGYLDPESEGSLEEDLARRRFRALLPEDDYDSDDY